ncbi:hypothetical protein H2248_007026 [Termitomyces sp. 'cryptogamus']|nr:hypothetical protein H2248_007026 [Termitomyces sp. 'cryptogamus']
MAMNMHGAPNVSKLWEVLEHDIKKLSENPESRFEISDHQESKNSQRCMKARTGNFIEGADESDNKLVLARRKAWI